MEGIIITLIILVGFPLLNIFLENTPGAKEKRRLKRENFELQIQNDKLKDELLSKAPTHTISSLDDLQKFISAHKNYYYINAHANFPTYFISDLPIIVEGNVTAIYKFWYYGESKFCRKRLNITEIPDSLDYNK